MANEKRDYRDDEGFCRVRVDESFISAHPKCEYYKERKLANLVVCKYCEIMDDAKCTRPDPISEKEESADE